MIYLKNSGELDINFIKLMGVNVKESSDCIGYFGTGMKYAVAIFLREGINFSLFIGKVEYTFETETKTLRNKDFDVVVMRGPYDSVELAITTELGKHWEPWQAYREIESNCRDEGGEVSNSYLAPEEGYTTFVIEDIEGAKEVFLSNTNKKRIHSDKFVDIYEGQSDCIYYRGIKAKDISGRPSLYTYNIKQECTLTEDRLISYDFHVERAIAKSVTGCNNKDMIKEIITANSSFFEHSVDFEWDNNEEPSETFMETYEESSKDCNYTVRNFVTSKIPKPPETKKEKAERFERELSDFCDTFELNYDIDKDGYITIIATDILNTEE